MISAHVVELLGPQIGCSTTLSGAPALIREHVDKYHTFPPQAKSHVVVVGGTGRAAQLRPRTRKCTRSRRSLGYVFAPFRLRDASYVILLPRVEGCSPWHTPLPRSPLMFFSPPPFSLIFLLCPFFPRPQTTSSPTSRSSSLRTRMALSGPVTRVHAFPQRTAHMCLGNYRQPACFLARLLACLQGRRSKKEKVRSLNPIKKNRDGLCSYPRRVCACVGSQVLL